MILISLLREIHFNTEYSHLITYTSINNHHLKHFTNSHTKQSPKYKERNNKYLMSYSALQY